MGSKYVALIEPFKEPFLLRVTATEMFFFFKNKLNVLISFSDFQC